MLEYSPFKPYYHLHRLRAIEEGLLVAPVAVQVDLTGRCNHNCSHCFYRFYGTKLSPDFVETQAVPLSSLLVLVEDMATMGVRAVEYTGGGEPLFYPRFDLVLETTIAAKLEIALVSNGTLLNDAVVAQLARSCTWVRISLDAWNAEQYQQTHRVKVGEFEKACSAVKRLVTETKATVGVSFITTPHNYSGIPAFVRFARDDLGAHNCRLSIAYTPEGAVPFDAIILEMRALEAQAHAEQRPNFRVFSFLDPYFSALNTRQKDYKQCYYQHLVTAIGNDGFIYPCCAVKYDARWRIGSIVQQRFSEVWRQRQQWLQKQFDLAKCPACWMDGKNRFCEYLLMDKPPHVNFP